MGSFAFWIEWNRNIKIRDFLIEIWSARTWMKGRMFLEILGCGKVLLQCSQAKERFRWCADFLWVFKLSMRLYDFSHWSHACCSFESRFRLLRMPFRSFLSVLQAAKPTLEFLMFCIAWRRLVSPVLFISITSSDGLIFFSKSFDSFLIIAAYSSTVHSNGSFCTRSGSSD